MELREKLARAIYYDTEPDEIERLVAGELNGTLGSVDRILAIPEIKLALGCLSGGSLTWEKRMGLRD